MLSFEKEVEHSRLDNLLVLLYLQYGSLQAAMDGAFEKVWASRDMLNLAAKRLLSKYSPSDDPQLRLDVQKFVDCCKTMCTGNAIWSLQSGRYRLGVDSLVGGVEAAL